MPVSETFDHFLTMQERQDAKARVAASAPQRGPRPASDPMPPQ
jgi:hypothetical protein